MISYGHLSDFLKSDFLFHVHFSVVICDFLVESSSITIVLMHVSFKIHYRNNLIDKKHSYLIPRPPSWDDRSCSYGHQLYPSDCWGTFKQVIPNLVRTTYACFWNNLRQVRSRSKWLEAKFIKCLRASRPKGA